MTKSWNRLLALALLAGGATAFSACGDDDDANGGGGAADAGDDTGDAAGDTGPSLDIGPGTDTGGGTCANPCTRPGDCGAGFDCVDGCCTASGGGGGAPCARPLDACASDSQSTANFLCETALGLCLQRCATSETDDTRGRNCPTGSFCVNGDGPGVEDPMTGRVIDGYCLPGDCDGSLFDDDACEGVNAVLTPGSRCTSDDCTCQPFANGASFCFPAGTARAGDECGRATGNTIPANQLCEAGLLCGDGRCEVPCNLRSGATACESGPAADACPETGDCACLTAYDTTPRNQPGVCAVSCRPFESGVCPTGQQCLPRFGRFGINTWMCADNGAPTLPGEGEECDSTLGQFAACEEGMICTRESESGPTVCLRYCSPAALGAGCGDDAPGATLFGPLAYGAASDFAPLAAGTVATTVRDAATGALIAPLEVTVTEDTYTTWIAVADATAGAAFLSFDDDAATVESGVRFFHGSADAGDVDVYIGAWLQGLGYGDGPLYIDPPAGAFRAGVYLGADEILSAVLELEEGEVYTAWAWLDGTEPTLGLAVADEAPTFAADSGTAAIRFLHGATGGPAVDVYVGCIIDPVDLSKATGCDPTFADIAYGSGDAMGEWAIVNADEDVVITVFAAGADITTATPILTAEVDLDENTTYLLIASLEGTDVTAGLYEEDLEVSDDAVALAVIHAASGVGSVDILGEFDPSVEGLSFGEIGADAERGYFELFDAPMNLAVRAAEAGLEGDAVLSSGPLTLEGLSTVVVAGLAGADSLGVFIADDFYGSLAAGQGAIRVIHAAPAVGGVTINAIAESGNVCTPTAIDGFGLCAEGCTPYPRTGGGGYDCEDTTNTCFPFSPRDDRPVAPLGACQPDSGTGAAGDTCGTVGRLGGDCADFAVCLGENQGDVSGSCLPLCEPFASDACGDFGTCSGVPPLVGQLNFSFCLPDAQPGAAFDRCTENGLPCAEDGTICLALGQGAPQLCYPICRQGFQDCEGFSNRRCVTGQLNPDVVPTFMGLCQ